jgi:ABC-type Zn uptake system ZnuABC Zn-binding protein ZnuA
VGGAVFVCAALPRALPALAAATLLAGCGSGTGAGAVATTTQLGDWTRIVAGNAVAVHQILQANTDPHEYEPRPDDVKATARARIVFESGEGLDEWMGKVVGNAGGNPRVVVVGAHIPVRRRSDPHWWLDPRNAEAAVATIRDSLSAQFPGQATTFRRNASAYLDRLRAVDRSIAACFARVPASDRKLVTDHDAFAYFAARYGITVVGAVIPSLTTQAQPSAGETARLIRLVRREHVRAIFPEHSVSPRLARTVARATGASSDHELFGDALGKGQTYLEMEVSNADAMVRGFTGGKLGC